MEKGVDRIYERVPKNKKQKKKKRKKKKKEEEFMQEFPNLQYLSYFLSHKL